MKPKRSKADCAICNPEGAEEGKYCERHEEELHRLEHRYGNTFRLQRECRGKDHESYSIFMESECDACGRLFLQETDPNNLSITVLMAEEIKLHTAVPEYEALGIHRTWGDLLRTRIEIDLVRSWYGRARACIEVYPANFEGQIHWDVETAEDLPTDDDAEDVPADPHSHGGGKHSVH